METETQNNQPGPKSPSSLQEIGAFFWDLVKILVVALVIIIPVRTFLAEPFVVSGSSMFPNFHNGDYLIIDRISYRFQQPQRGQVVVFKYPKDTSQYFIKRIIGLPGETTCFWQGHVIISKSVLTSQQCAEGQGPILKELYLPKGVETFGQPGPVTLGNGEYFVLGDNRTASSDSRDWGILPQDDLVGKVWLRVLPVSRFASIPQPAY